MPQMDKKELRKLSKNELIALFFAERETRLKLEMRLEEIERLLNAFDNPHTPSSKIRSKKNTEQDDSKPRFPGKPEGSNGGGIKMPSPDRKVEVTKNTCSCCGKKLGNPYDYYCFKQMDVPKPFFITTLYRVALYQCSCGAKIDACMDLQKGFYGPNTTAFIGSLRVECLSYEAISRLLQQTYKVPISNVTVFNKITALSCLMSP